MTISPRRLNKATVRKLLSFLAVGVSASAVYSICCVILVLLYPAHKYAISVLTFIAMIPIGFFGQKFFTFRSRGAISQEFVLYAALQTTSIIITTILMGRFITESPFLNLIVFLIIAGLAAVISFFFCNLVVFRPVRPE
jgi:putative flippase GtrA